MQYRFVRGARCRCARTAEGRTVFIEMVCSDVV